MPGFRLWLRLQWYNRVSRHWNHFWFRRRYYQDWLDQGGAPDLFQAPGKITKETMDWARGEVNRLRVDGHIK